MWAASGAAQRGGCREGLPGCGEHLGAAAAAAEAVLLGTVCMLQTDRPSCRQLGWFGTCCAVVLWCGCSGVGLSHLLSVVAVQ